MKELRVRRGQRKSIITQLADFIERITDAADPKAKEIPFRRSKVEQLFTELEGIQVEIEVLGEEDPEEQMADRTNVEDKYYSSFARAANLLEVHGSPARSTPYASGKSDPESVSEFRGFPRRTPVNVKLPQLSTPEFGGPMTAGHNLTILSAP